MVRVTAAVLALLVAAPAFAQAPPEPTTDAPPAAPGAAAPAAPAADPAAPAATPGAPAAAPAAPAAAAAAPIDPATIAGDWIAVAVPGQPAACTADGYIVNFAASATGVTMSVSSQTAGVKGTPVVTEFAVVAPAPAGANPAIGLFLNSVAKARAIGLASTGADTLAMYPAGDNTYPAANVNMKKCAG